MSDFANDVRLHIFQTALTTGQVPQAPDIARALQQPESDVRDALKQLADARIIVLASNDASIWIAAPFSAVPSRFRVEVDGRRYFAICIWDALGVIAISGRGRGVVKAGCGDCGEAIGLEVDAGKLSRSESVVHFGVPARRWWDNIGFT